MSTFETYYDINPVAVIDQNKWDLKMPEVAMQFRNQPVVYTPLIDYNDDTQRTGAETTTYTEMIEGDVDVAEIPLTANYIDAPLNVDSRARQLAVKRYGDKVQLHESSNIFQQWQMSGGRDWRPLLRGLLGQSVVKKMEMLARNSFLNGPKAHWTYADGGGSPTDIGSITSADTFNMEMVNAWNLRLGNTGSPVVPGDMASAKIAIIPPGVVYDFMASIAAASSNEASMWRDAQLYSGKEIRYELGSFKNIRFVQHPNDKYGLNNAVLYNTGAITFQYGVTTVINAGDGSPDPETTKVDETWYVGQKDVNHLIQLENFGANDFAIGDIVTIHTVRTSALGVTNGVNPVAVKNSVRKIVALDAAANTLSFDRPLSFAYTAPFVATPVSGAAGTYYAFVTKARHIGFVLVLGSRGGIMASVARPIKFYEPKPIDDFDSVWRYVWDIIQGYNIWEPNLFECHFCALTLPTVGGLITP
jgi:hypothetical protein